MTCDRHVVAEHRQRLDDAAVARGQLRQPLADDAARVGGDAPAELAVAGQLACELAQQPRVAGRVAVARAGRCDRRVRHGPAQQRERVARRQRLRPEHGRQPRAADHAQLVRVPARRDQQQQRQVLDPPREVGEHRQRRLVGEVRVVDDQRERSLRGQLLTDPQHAVRDQHHRRVATWRARVHQQRTGDGGWAVQGHAALAHRRLEQRPDHAERQVVLQRPGGGSADEPADVLGQHARVFEKDGFAQPGRGFEHDDTTATADRGAYRIDFEITFDQPYRSNWSAGGIDEVEVPHRFRSIHRLDTKVVRR